MSARANARATITIRINCRPRVSTSKIARRHHGSAAVVMARDYHTPGTLLRINWVDAAQPLTTNAAGGRKGVRRS
jgi:hypothetical protein